MLSRRTTLLVADLLEAAFSKPQTTYSTIDASQVYDFLFENDYPAWFCNAAKATYTSVGTRNFKEFILKIHTGESLYAATEDWTWPQREKLGQEILEELTEDIIGWWGSKGDFRMHYDVRKTIAECRQSIELDGYVFRGDTLLAPEADNLDAKEESGVLQSLYKELGLQNKERVFHHLELSEEHYLAKRWEDCISNSRKFLEGVLQEIAAKHHLASRSVPIDEATVSHPASVRKYLETSGLLEPKEKEALSAIYGLLSETGGHPYMAQHEQARLLRHLALTLSQFALLRLQGSKREGA